MSLENFFQRESSTSLFAFWALLLFLYGVLGAVFSVFAWCSMLLCVTFNVGMRDVCDMLGRSVGKGIFKRRRKGQLLSAFFYHVADCVRVSVDSRFRFHHHGMDLAEAVCTSSYDYSR